MPNPFVSRLFEIDRQEVECRFYTPEQDKGGFRCRYVIDLPDKPIKSQGYGFDQIQALLLAMKKAHLELLIMRDKLGQRVELNEENNLGLPMNESLRNLSPENDY